MLAPDVMFYSQNALNLTSAGAMPQTPKAKLTAFPQNLLAGCTEGREGRTGEKGKEGGGEKRGPST